MTQAEWNARIAARGDVWQYFKMDESSGLPQDSSPAYGFCDMTAGSGNTYEIAGPFSGAKAISVATMFDSPVYHPSPALDVNYADPKTIEFWLYLNNAPSLARVLTAAGNMAIGMGTDRKLQLSRLGVVAGPISDYVYPLNQWHFVMLTIPSGGADMILYVDENVVLTWNGAWPIPNGNFLWAVGQSGPSGTFTFSNMALINGGPLTPDIGATLETPQVYRTGVVF